LRNVFARVDVENNFFENLVRPMEALENVTSYGEG
jgi:hypothetical protein